MKLPSSVTSARPPVAKPPSSPTRLSGTFQPRKSLLVRTPSSQDTPSPLLTRNGPPSPSKMNQSVAASLTKRTSSPLSLPPVQFSPLPSSPIPSPQATSGSAVSVQCSRPLLSNLSRSLRSRMIMNFKNYGPKFVFLKHDARTTRNGFVS